jgi:hypothetical protein
MSSELVAWIGALSTMTSQPLTPPYRLVRLGQGMAMIPMLHAVDDAAEKSDDLLMRLSEAGPVADIHAMAYGDARAQIVKVWRGRRPHLDPDEPDAVNKALRLLGVTAEPGLDEFDTIGLGRQRDTEDW